MANPGSGLHLSHRAKTGMFKKVYLVFDNKHLMERDRADFQDLWRLVGCENKVEYHVGCDFEPE